MPTLDPDRLRIAAIDFLNPAPLMWDFEHPPHDAPLALRYQIDRMLPSECAVRLATGAADLGLIPIAALATTPGLHILPGCVIASKGQIRSLLLVRRAGQTLTGLRSVAADAASRTTLAYARILFHQWGNPDVPFVPMAADLDAMLLKADAAILIGDPALLALEHAELRKERTGEELVYHDLAQEWTSLTGVPFVSAVWSASASGRPLDEIVTDDLNQSRIHGLQNIDALVAEWSLRLSLPAESIQTYLTRNIHYHLDEECIQGMRLFFQMAEEADILPPYQFSIADR